MKAVQPAENPFLNLKKLLQIHRRQTKYEVTDTYPYIRLSRKMTSSHPRNDLTDQQFRTLWVIFEELYFKRIGKQELKCFKYIDETFEELRSERIYKTEKGNFVDDLYTIFQDDYINKKLCEDKKNQKNENWVNLMFLIWQNCTLNQGKKFENKKPLTLEETTPEHKNKDVPMTQLDYLIQMAEQEWETIVTDNKKSIQKIRTRIAQENIKPSLLLEMKTDKNEQLEDQCLKSTVNRIMFVNYQLQYIKYQIPILERKQVAESILKLTRLESKQQQVGFMISFESGLDFQNKILSQTDFTTLNSLRDISLLNFYFTGRKSLFNNTSHNFYGFQGLYDKNSMIKNISRQVFLDKIKENTEFNYQNEAQILFGKMEMCHHCKNLFEPLCLKKCNFSSMIPPKNVPLNCHDEYLESIIKNQNITNDQKKQLYESNNRISEYARYAFVKNQYTCNRFFCKTCIKIYSYVKTDKLCPYCLGVCQCSRCLRNDLIFKLRSIFVKLGGRLQDIHHDSYYQQVFCLKQEEDQKVENQVMVGSQRSKIKYYVDELQRIRLLSHQVKKRQVLKLKLFKQRKRIQDSQIIKILSEQQTIPTS